MIEWLDVDAWAVDGMQVRRVGDRLECACDPVFCRHRLEVKRLLHEAPKPKPNDPLFGPPLPDWVREFRDVQWRAIEEIVLAFRAIRARPAVVILEGPTGLGKTLVGETVRRLLGMPGVYLCTTKSLQRQFLRDFPYAKLLMGRRNYPTLKYPDEYKAGRYLSCEDCNKRKVGERWVCSWCDPPSRCPYERAKLEALEAPLAVLNTAYWLAEVNGAGRFSEASERERRAPHLVIVDEADELEQELMRHLEVRLSARLLKTLQVGLPQRKTRPETWDAWLVEQVIPALSAHVEELAREVDARPDDVYALRAYRSATQTLEAVRRVAGSLSGEEARWVYVDPEKADDASVTFKPVKVDREAHRALWGHADWWLLMSATIISASQLAEDLGLSTEQWRFVRVPSTFAPERRPVYVPLSGLPAVTHKTRQEDWPRLVEALDRILDGYPTQRVLVHTVSYDLARYVVSHSRHRHRMVRYDDAGHRDLALAALRERAGAVLIAPSMERGIDLRDDDCRVVVVLKVPYPNLGDKQIATRVYATRGGERWYLVQTVRRLVQMTGRAVRSETDWAHHYILDAQFVELRRKAKGLLPAWWEKALVWVKGVDSLGVQPQAEAR